MISTIFGMAVSPSTADGRILITGPLTEGSGNYSTANRILGYFEQRGTRCLARNVSDFESLSNFRNFLTSERIRCVLAIHAYKCRTVLQDCPIPFALIFGGTDLNENTKVDSDRKTVIKIAMLARYLVVFSKEMYEKVIELMPTFDRVRIWTVPQAVKTYPADYDWRAEHNIEVDSTVFTLVAGLRPVKDPLYLVPCFTNWTTRNLHRKAVLAIVGPEHDKEFSTSFFKTIQNSRVVLYLGALSMSQTHRVIADSFALVNSSISEGMSTAILESMELGVPVIARDILGNASIVEHRRTGMLFRDPEEFLEMAELLMDDPDLRSSLIENGRRQIKDRHNWETERRSYFELVKKFDIESSIEGHQKVAPAVVENDGSSHFESRNGH